MYLRFPSVIFTQQGYGIYGPDTTIDPQKVLGVEAKVHHFSSSKPDQHMSYIHLDSGAKVEVFMRSERVTRAVEEALAKIQQDALGDANAPEMLAIYQRALELACNMLAGHVAPTAEELMADFIRLADRKENLAALQVTA